MELLLCGNPSLAICFVEKILMHFPRSKKKALSVNVSECLLLLQSIESSTALARQVDAIANERDVKL